MSYISAALSESKDKVLVWERHGKNRITKEYEAPYSFFVRDDNGIYQDIYNNKLSKLDFDNKYDYYSTRKRLNEANEELYESDISPVYKILSEKYYSKESTKINYTFYDIEVDYDPHKGFAGPENPYAPISAISLYHSHSNRRVLLVVLPSNGKWEEKDIPEDLYDICEIYLCKDEKELLYKFLHEIDDSDIISGWNSAGYDDPYVYLRLMNVLGIAYANKLSFTDAPEPQLYEKEIFRGTIAQRINIFGRIAIDYLEIFKKFQTKERPSNSLDAISEEFLPHLKKIEFEGSLYELYYNDFPTFCRYNVRDTEVLDGLENILGYMEIAIHNYHDSTCLMNDVLGTVKLVECAMINYCHYDLDVKVSDTKIQDYEDSKKFAGALVLPPITGMHEWVFSVDVNSLYPSSIRSLNISPETIIGQFHEREEAYNLIYNNNAEQNLTLFFEDGNVLTESISFWRNYLLRNNYNISGYGTVFTQEKMGIIPTLLTRWYEDRKVYKKKMKTAFQKMKEAEENSKEYKKYKQEYEYYNRVQFLKKLLLNSTYGCMGNKYFKFYDIRMAESTTRSGREFLMHMVKTIAYIFDGEYTWPSESCIYSDTDSCYAKSHATTLEETLKIAKFVEKKVNTSFSKFATKAFFCNNDYNNLVKAELDTIADKAIFVKKKYYVMHLLYSDGFPKEEMKVMGLQIKKTTIPKKIGKKLTNVIQEYLTGTDWSEISKQVVDYKQHLKNAKITEIGLPKGIKNVEDYTNRYNMNEPELRLPGHVAASMLYNKCLEEYNDKESPKIISGMKIKTYYLTKRLGYFKSIALPTDLSNPPKWFTKHFEPIIDKEAQIYRLIDKPLQSIFDAIDKLAPTEKTILVDDMFEY